MRGVAQTGAAVILAHRDAENTKRAEFLPQMGWKIIVAIGLGGDRGDLLDRKSPHTVAQGINVRAQGKREAAFVHARAPARRLTGLSYRDCRKLQIWISIPAEERVR